VGAISRDDRARMVSTKLDPASNEPLRSQIVRTIIRSLDAGAFRHGFLSEHELAQR